MRKRARTDLCGGRSVMIVPTATVGGALENDVASALCSGDEAQLDVPKIVVLTSLQVNGLHAGYRVSPPEFRPVGP